MAASSLGSAGAVCCEVGGYVGDEIAGAFVVLVPASAQVVVVGPPRIAADLGVQVGSAWRAWCLRSCGGECGARPARLPMRRLVLPHVNSRPGTWPQCSHRAGM